MSSPNLVTRLAEKDPTALDEFYKTYRHRILAVARRIVSDEWDAEEVMQDVLWSVFRKAESFRGDAGFWSWVYRVTQNAAKMHLRKQHRVPTPVADADLNALPSNSAFQPEEMASQHFAMERMNQELRRLDPVNQELYWSLEVVGTPKEIVADRLGLSVSAVKSRLHRIRRSLREAFESQSPTAS